MKKIYKNKYIILIILVTVLLCGCATIPCPVFEKDGKKYGSVPNFQGQWDDYYQCGLSYIESGEFYTNALWALDQAIAQRYRDQRKARTYGLHFIDDYFPHREKGLVYYLTGDYENALVELEISLSHEPSEKAYKIRDKVRIKRIEQEKKDISIPSLMPDPALYSIFHKESEDTYTIRTKNDPVVISGIAADAQYVSEITLREKQLFQDGKPLFLAYSDQKIEFREDLKLNQGKFDIKITARNLRGGENSINLVIHVDRSGPVITLTGYKPDVGIQGWLYDESGISDLIANGNPVRVSKNRDAFFTIPLISEMKNIMLTARDKLGNETKTYLHIDQLALNTSPILFAQSKETQITDGQSSPMISELPEIQLQDLCEQHTVFSERILIQGQVRSRTDITELYINDFNILHRTGTDIVFSHSADLNPGENILEIRAANTSGITIKKLVIIRKIPEIYHIRHRYKLAIYPFIYTGDISNNNLLSFDNFLKGFTDRNRFQIVVRENTEEVSDTSQISCHAMLGGVVNESVNGVEAVARMVDIQTSEVLAIEDGYAESKDRASLDMITERLIEKIHRKFPLIKGVITDISWFFKRISVSSEGEIRKNWQLINYREKENISPCSTGSDTEVLGECIYNGKCKEKPDKGDKIVTR